MKVDEDQLPNDVELIGEPLEISIVVCKRCEQQIGRLQPAPAGRERDKKKVYVEVRQLADEHRPACPGVSQ